MTTVNGRFIRDGGPAEGAFPYELGLAPLTEAVKGIGRRIGAFGTYKHNHTQIEMIRIYFYQTGAKYKSLIFLGQEVFSPRTRCGDIVYVAAVSLLEESVFPLGARLIRQAIPTLMEK